MMDYVNELLKFRQAELIQEIAAMEHTKQLVEVELKDRTKRLEIAKDRLEQLNKALEPVIIVANGTANKEAVKSIIVANGTANKEAVKSIFEQLDREAKLRGGK
jgi:hypothetical protein